ncbi:hypothetical protein PRZ48_001643 [Zasmidium cellare]|uniref:RING-type domain-containing protein n=1 Tax=Zasmidium cellare TaxID=395010 RepID=A0ABR0F490_ZASCE|nr:hypothetical protein PRZ48_001643 [Zasmidium cellare]
MEHFLNSLDKPSLFPPKCCSLIQLYTLLPRLDAAKAALYREKMEEWLCNEKTYCPAPTCSAFIPERLIPPAKVAPSQTHLHETISNLLHKLDSTPYARFFRGDLNMERLPGFRDAVANPISLKDIKRKNESRLYSSIADLANDVVLLVENAKRFNGDYHPITHAANGLFGFFIENISTGSGIGSEPSDAKTIESRDFFPCPKCHVAICTACKQVEHSGKPCDTGRESYELAMLEQFGYKQCPRCKQGVRRMFGCSHMQCTCGAHWCWRCTKSLEQCMGDCPAEDGFDEDVDDEDEDEMDEEEDEDDEAEKNEDSGFVEGAQTVANNAPHPAPSQVPTDNQRQDPPLAPTNLDAGGDARWGQAAEDFGEEPEEEPMNQIWSCHHYFVKFRDPDDGFDHGNLDYLECNRCFKSIKPMPRRKDVEARRRSKGRGTVKEEEQAWDCEYCRLIVCIDCKTKKYQGSRSQTHDQNLRLQHEHIFWQAMADVSGLRSPQLEWQQLKQSFVASYWSMGVMTSSKAFLHVFQWFAPQ